jgi:hypothetical protein
MAAKYTEVLRGIPGAFFECPTMSSLNRKNEPNSCGEKSLTGAKPRNLKFLIQSISIFTIIRFPHSLSLGLAPAGFHFDPSFHSHPPLSPISVKAASATVQSFRKQQASSMAFAYLQNWKNWDLWM